MANVMKSTGFYTISNCGLDVAYNSQMAANVLTIVNSGLDAAYSGLQRPRVAYARDFKEI